MRFWSRGAMSKVKVWMEVDLIVLGKMDEYITNWIVGWLHMYEYVFDYHLYRCDFLLEVWIMDKKEGQVGDIFEFTFSKFAGDLKSFMSRLNLGRGKVAVGICNVEECIVIEIPSDMEVLKSIYGEGDDWDEDYKNINCCDEEHKFYYCEEDDWLDRYEDTVLEDRRWSMHYGIKEVVKEIIEEKD
jgi:hypothetical protein